MTTSRDTTTFRPEIQGLRAIAVGGVILYHVWPNILPGGYVGVDVFFVISGFLITDLLMREVAATGRLSIVGFYERRVRRLIPAATLVLVASALLTLALPMARWDSTAAQIVASALYVENWWLAGSAVDYLAQEAPPSVVQHYWSLSIEEQFYLVWPILLVTIAALAARFTVRTRPLALGALVAITVASLATSIVWTAIEPASAYFVTFTRMWELGAGGLLAIVALRPPGPRVAETLRVAGLLAIAASFALFNTETPFPGFAALLPVLGCAAVIAAGSAGPRFGLMRPLGWRSAQYLGDVSYSAYLWHWPLTVVVAVLGRTSPTFVGGLIIITVTLVLSALTKRYVEDRFRRPTGKGQWRVIAAGAGAILVCLIPALLLPIPLGWSPDREYLQAAKDVADLYAKGCHLKDREFEPRPCIGGAPNGTASIFLVGDSHAASWAPALEDAALARNWRIETDTKGSCALLVEPLQQSDGANVNCFEWGKRVLARIKSERPDLVLLTMRSRNRRPVDGTLQEAMVNTWEAIRATGARVVVIAATPEQASSPIDCALVDPHCSTPMRKALLKDPQLDAQRLDPQVGLINMNDAFCPNGTCPVVMDGIVAWRDEHHFTASFSRTLAPAFGERVASFLDEAAL